MTQIEKIAMVGLGNMGGRIARRIDGAGWDLSGYDADPEKRAGAEVATVDSLEQVAAADAIFFSLPDSRVVEIVVDLSTADPSSSRRIYADLGAKGVEFLDAGISGGAAAAASGTLTIMAGGSEDALARVAAVFDAFSQRVFHMGSPGSGHVAKVLNNYLNAMNLSASAEVVVAAKKSGLDLRQFLEVVNSSSGVNFATLKRFPQIIEGDYMEGGLTTNLMAKDVRLYLELMRTLEATSFTGPACLGTFDLANALGYGDQISNRVVDAIGDVSGGVRAQADGGQGA